MSEKQPSKWTEEQVKELMVAGKIPKGPERSAAFAEIAKKVGKNQKTVEQKFYVTRKEKDNKKEKRKYTKVAKKSPGQKSYETRMKNKELGITYKDNRRKYHNPPKETGMQISRNELRFPFKKISIEGGDVVVSF